jgi:selenocysteine lyase/cysteine desulfurase
MPEVLPIKFEAGSQNVLAIAGLYAALRWINKIGAESIMEQESASRARLLELLHQYDMLEIIEPKGPAVGVISCNVKGYSSDSIGEVFSELGVACRVGLHCSPSAHRFLGTYPAGSVRFSVGYFTNNEDFDGLRNALDYIEENM